MRKCVKGFFTVSLILNVLLLGLIGGHFYQMWQHHPWQEVRGDLKPENQNFVASTFQNSFRDIREVGDEARKVRAELVTILSAEKFDEKAFDAAIKKLAVTRNKIAAIKVKTTKDLAMKLSQEERAKMAERMAKMVGGGWEKRVERDRRPHEIPGGPPPEGDKPPPRD
jgi:uncharacterized membrane protein